GRAVSDHATDRQAVPRLHGGWSYAIPAGLAAIVVGILVLPAFLLSGGLVGHAPAPVKDLEVKSVAGPVVLTWSDGNEPRRVIRATRREDLAKPERLQGELALGERWIDNHADNAQVVYYLVN